MTRTFIIGCGVTAFIKPRGLRETHDMALEACVKALLDAGITYDECEAGFAGYCYGDSTCGQRALYQLGMTSIPIVNVNNNCSTGSSALYLANTYVKNGAAKCAIAVGFEKMAPGSLKSNWPDRKPPMEQWVYSMKEFGGKSTGPMAAQQFGNAGMEYDELHGSNVTHLAQISSKNHKHSTVNEYSQFRWAMTPEEVLNARKITETLTLPMCSPTSDGAGCCIIANEEFVHSHGLENQAIEIVSQCLATDSPDTFEKRSLQEIAGANMTRYASKQIFQEANTTPDQVGVIELHDCFAANELITYDAIGLCKHGEAHKICERGDNTYGGKWVINPSGGLEAKGHPLGATGLGMHFYIAMQLRNRAGPMQAPGLFDQDKQGKFGLVHNLGLGGAVVMSLLRRPEFYKEGQGEEGRDRLGYEHGFVCKPITRAQLDKVKAKESSRIVLERALPANL